MPRRDPRYGRGFRLAIEAGRKAYLTGMGRVLAREAAPDPDQFPGELIKPE